MGSVRRVNNGVPYGDPLTIQQALEANWIEILGAGLPSILAARSVDGNSYQIDIPETPAMTAHKEETPRGLDSTLNWMQTLGEYPDISLYDVWDHRAYGTNSNNKDVADLFGSQIDLFSMQDEISAARARDGTNLVYFAHQQTAESYRRVVMKENFQIQAFNGPNADRAAMEFATQGSGGKLVVALAGDIHIYEQFQTYQNSTSELLKIATKASELNQERLSTYNDIAQAGTAGTILVGLQLTAGDLLSDPRNIEIVDRELEPYFKTPELGYRYMIGPEASSGSYTDAISYEQPPIDGSTFPTIGRFTGALPSCCCGLFSIATRNEYSN